MEIKERRPGEREERKGEEDEGVRTEKELIKGQGEGGKGVYGEGEREEEPGGNKIRRGREKKIGKETSMGGTEREQV